MPASSTPTPQHASASSSIGAPVDFDDLLAKDRQLAQAELERMALLNISTCIIREQANAAADEHDMEFEPDWGGSGPEYVYTEPSFYMEPEEEPIVQAPQPEELGVQSGDDRVGAYRRHGLPRCLVTRVSDVYI